MEYANYQYYIDTYKGSLSNSLFSSYILKASKEIDKNINTILTEAITAGLTEKEQDNIKHTACLLVDYLYNYRNILNSTYTSLSIDGVNKVIKPKVEIKAEKVEILDNLPQCLTRYL